MDRLSHWEGVYRTKGAEQVSWFQAEARRSLALIERVAPDRAARIIDVGAGASTLVDGLLGAGYRQMTVVDLSSTALDIAQRRIGATAGTATWLAGDVLSIPFAAAAFDVWHDRAVFHFSHCPRIARAMSRRCAAPSAPAATCSWRRSPTTGRCVAVASRSRGTPPRRCTPSSVRTSAWWPASGKCTRRPPAPSRPSPTVCAASSQ